MGVIDQIGSSVASGMAGTIGSLPGTLVNLGLGNYLQDRQLSKSKELLDYQWKNYQSPEAQVRSMAAAGLNPAATLGGHGSFSAPAASLPTSAPVQVDGVSDVLSSLTQLKKVDKDNELVDQEIYKTLAEKGLIDEQRHGQVVANTILEAYGDKEAAARIANLGGQTALYASQQDLNKANESLVNLKKETEKVYKDLLHENKLKAALEVKNYQRYIESVISSNQASVKASEASAELSREQAKTEDDLREVRKFAIDLGNHLQGLEYGFNIDTYQQRLEKFANEVGITKWTNFLNEIEAKDRASYNAVQRIIMGKGTKEDGKTLWNFINDGRQLIPFKD